MKSYEKLGAFYLGRLYDPKSEAIAEDLLLYEAKDLTTHAVCVGMTGSGKTGLCVTLLEEAAIDGIPALVIDPKGDLGNLLLAFPGLKAASFRPWIPEAEAAREGVTPDEYAARVAERWRRGLQDWDQEPDRIDRFLSAVDTAIYTPGSSAGLPLRVLRSFQPPAPALVEDADALRDRVLATVSGLLGLLGIEADPIRSREHILLANLLERAWSEGRSLELGDLIREIQQPPLEKIGVMDLESFYPAKERFELSMSLNNLLASPGFASWMEGEPLDIARLLHTAEGRPRLSILSIAHLSEAQRMFFVTLLLNEVLAWMRTQPGTGSLRAILYMDEIYGFFPPTANPPSKKPMLTLLKQARAYGLGVVLATQNPVDLDYKGLSNAGTWFLGRLQTERDKSRVLEGLEGASTSAGQSFDRGRMEETLSRLKSRVFLMNNVHEDRPVQFHTRWALSYLRGPLTRVQIQELMDPRRPSPATVTPPAASPRAASTVRRGEVPSSLGIGGPRPVLPPGIEEGFLPATRSCEAEGKLLYRPALLGAARLHYSQTRTDIDVWKEVALLAPLDASKSTDPWKGNQAREQGAPGWESEPDSAGHFDKLPTAATQPNSYTTWTKQLKDHLYRTQPLSIWTCQAFKTVSEVGESEGDFRIRLGLLIHEKRDAEVEKLRKRYAPKLAGLEDRIRRAEQQVQREQSQYQQQKTQTMISVGATVLGALFGRKVASVGTVGRATTSMRGMTRSAREKEDIRRAQDSLESLRQRLEDLEASFGQEAEQLRERWNPESLELKKLEVRPRKSDITVDRVALAWVPWIVDAVGVVRPASSDE